MQLLTPQDVKSERDHELNEKRSLIARLAEEEARVNAMLNIAKQRFAEDMEKMEEDFEEFKNQMLSKRTSLVQEIGALESRRNDAMKPVDDLRKEAENTMKMVREDELAVRSREIAVLDRENDLADRLSSVIDRETEVSEKEAEIEQKQAKIDQETEILRASSRALSEKWAEYHTKVHLFNAEAEEKSQKIASEIAGIEAGRKVNQEEALRLTNERRAIHDAYLALEQAKIHLGLTEKNHG